jgi:hypothetical protein
MAPVVSITSIVIVIKAVTSKVTISITVMSLKTELNAAAPSFKKFFIVIN